MKYRSMQLGWILMTVTAFVVAPASGQNPPPSTSNDGTPAPAPATQSTDPLPGGSISVSKPDSRQYILTGTDREISLDPLLKYRWIYGMDLTQGYDDGIVSFPVKTGTSYTLLMPMVGILGRTQKSEYLVQYTPTLSYFSNAGPGGIQAYHQGSMELHKEVSREWGWDLGLTVQDGTYPLSLLSEFSFGSLNGVPAVDPNSILLISSSGYFNSDASVGFHWRPSQRDTLAVSTIYSYTVFDQNAVPASSAGHIQRQNTTALYTRAITRRWNVLVNGNALHVFGALACTTYGAQFGASYEIRRETVISGTVGPEFGNGTCSNSTQIAFAGSVSSRLSRNWVGYLSAGRTQNGAVHSSLGSGLTETYVAGISRTLGKRLDMRLDGGYIKVDSLPGLPSSFAATGKFLSPRVGWKLSPYFELSFKYQWIDQKLNNANLDRNQGSITLQWRPNPRASF